MELWLDDQRETPSFSMGLFADRVNSILEAPLPKCLRLKGEMGSERHSIAIAGPSARGGGAVSSRGQRESAGPRCGKPIHEVLLDKGRLAAEQKEAMRQRAIEEELSELRPAPNVTYASLRNTPRRGEPIENRLLLRAKEAEERRACEARRREEEMLKEMSTIAPFQPNISRRGRFATPRARKMAAEARADWYRRREQCKEAARTAKILQDLSEVQGTPMINPHSERLAARRREKEGLSGLSGVEAMLERDRIAQMKRWEQHQLEKETEPTPQITLYAATLHRNGDVGERLYAESYEKEERRLRKQRELLVGDVAPFTPRISPYAAVTPRFHSVEDELMQKHIQSLTLKEEKRHREEEQELRRHQPAINPVSEAIAAKLPETSLERLYRHPRQTPRHVDPAAATAAATVAATATTMTAPSFQDSSNGDGGASRVASLPESMAEALQSYEERRLEKLRRLREEQEQRQRAECTFAPVTNGRGPTVGGSESVVERNQKWLVRREGRLRELRERKEAEKVRGCSFRPEREATPMNSSRGESVYGGDGTAWGVQEYLERQEEARRLRREREARLQRRPSSAPRPATTTPREFALGRRESVPVRSLRRPPQVPLMSPEKPEALLPEGRDDLSVYERIYNRIYNTVASGGTDDTEASLCMPPSLYR
ncbi:hypothetical protein DQ04_03741050 [Trypanosoma grayi]|uniref:hypothetical protein n=1 Tax=Trypanosoma grayi TaxID=71804 RepID=UPI0004F40A1F|nr:hypothetical protein DQ04_03741050 [Trypanosoma grayi]KEG10412.1 hypothetical protein DQ04_03741050 [Trypanosoma grayi]